MPHDLIVGIAFLAMLIAPAIVASFSGSSETNQK